MYRDRGVEKEFHSGEIGCWRALVTRVVNAITTHGEPSPVWFILLRMVVANNWPYVYVRPFGASDFLMKKQVSVPLCLQIPWNNRSSSLAKLQVQMSQYFGILMSWQYSSGSKVSLPMMALMKQLESAPRTYVRTAGA